jgi:DNA invertase Pin-like site-specific DNA recombinase
MKRVFAYLRVSTAQQVEGDGFPRQLDAVRRFCESKGWSVLRDFREQQSGSDSVMDRPKLAEAIELCTPELGVDTIVVERVDRLGRDLIVSELFFSECKRRGIQVFSADSGEELVNAEGDPTRVLIRQVLGALAQWEKSQLCKKLQSGRRKKALETGRPCGGTRPYGDNKDPVAAAIELRALSVMIGSWVGGASLSEVSDDLLENRFPNPSGGRRWSKSSIQFVLKQNGYYHGTKTD